MTPQKCSVIVACENCNKLISRQPYRLRYAAHQFCSNACRAAWQKATTVGEMSPCWVGGQPSVCCAQCGAEVVRDRAKIRRNSQSFCSRKCYELWKSQHMRGQLNSNWKPKVRTTCATCGVPVERPPSRVGEAERRRHFCCKACKTEWMRIRLSGENSPHWKGGNSPKYYGPNWNQQKRAARERDGYCCQVCGVPQSALGKSLDVHHITPFRQFGYVPGENDSFLEANDLNNLISLCHTCHKRVEARAIPLQPPLL